MNDWLFYNDIHERNIFPLSPFNRWESCFIRRLHGENILGSFWRKLQNVYFKVDMETTKGKTNPQKEGTDGVKNIIKAWAKVLIDYWDDSIPSESNEKEVEPHLAHVREIFEKYPLIESFYKETDASEKETDSPTSSGGN
jgi:hypothetical protein